MQTNEAPPAVKRGRPPFDPTEHRANVERMHGLGFPETDIAAVLEISPKTLRKHFRKELKTGHLKANDKVLTRLYKEATDGHIAATIFWAKTRCGFRQTAPIPPPPKHPGPSPGIAYICEPVLNEGEPNAH